MKMIILLLVWLIVPRDTTAQGVLPNRGILHPTQAGLDAIVELVTVVIHVMQFVRGNAATKLSCAQGNAIVLSCPSQSLNFLANSIPS